MGCIPKTLPFLTNLRRLAKATHTPPSSGLYPNAMRFSVLSYAEAAPALNFLGS